MKMKAVGSSKYETLVAVYETAPWRNIQSQSDIRVFEVDHGMDGPCYFSRWYRQVLHDL